MIETSLIVGRNLQLPIDAPEITPDLLATKTEAEIQKLKIWEGNAKVELGQVFQVSEKNDRDKDEALIRIVGNAAKVRRIGYRMATGSIVIEGNVGMYLGEEMSGGSILVTGNAESWLGVKMKGGQIKVKGDAGDLVGAGYRGTTHGMSGGSILIHGNAGDEIGCWMKNGTIRVKGNTGFMPGIHMNGGTILIEGNCEGRAGAQMRGGKIIVTGHTPSILPSLTFEDIQQKAKFGEEKIPGPFYLFSGDLNEDGKGKLSVSIANNPQLKWYERYLEA